MTELTDRILNLTGEAVLVIRNGSICRANFRAAELLGGDCVGKRSADYFGDVLGQIQSPLFLAQLSVNGTPLLLRCSTQPDGKLLFLSPVFDSITYPERHAGYTAQQLYDATRAGLIDRKVMAAGGISGKTLPLLADYGFGGAVISGDLWHRFNIHSGLDYKEVIGHFRKLRKAAG